MSTADHVAIRALQATYADVVTRMAFAELADLFVPDIRLVMELPRHHKEIVGPQAFGDYVAARIAHLEFFQFVVTNAVADVAGDTASGRTWFYELHQDAGHHRLVHLYGLYRDEFVRVDGRWWFAHRRFAPLAMTSRDPDRDLDVFLLPPDGS